MDGACLPCSASFIFSKPIIELSHRHNIPRRAVNICIFSYQRTHHHNVFLSRNENRSLRSHISEAICSFNAVNHNISACENSLRLRSYSSDTICAFKNFGGHFTREKHSNGISRFKICSAKLKEDADTEEDLWMSDLEFEVLQFMETSKNPFSFPTQSELMKAGRNDLVDAILQRGGWLASGWDLNHCTADKENVMKGTLRNEIRDTHMEAPDGEMSYANKCMKRGSSQMDNPNTHVAASHTELNPALDERQRAWNRVADLFGLTKPQKKSGHGGKIFDENRKSPKMIEQVESIGLLDNRVERDIESPQGCGSIPLRLTDQRNLKKKIIPKCETANISTKESREWMHELVKARKEALRNVKLSSREKRNGNTNNPVSISGRIRELEDELSTTLHMLQSGRGALAHDIKPNEVDGRNFQNINNEEPSDTLDNFHKMEVSSRHGTAPQLNASEHNLSPHEIEEASDALEFRETELLRKRRELREARAKLTVTEGKLALQLAELQRNIEAKDKRLDEAMNVLKSMRTARIVWPNPAFEVFLAGSFDGWTSQRKMQKSNAGVFVTSLQLYPGRYEIKFIVNGEWKVDHNRPITGEGGYENNVLIIV